METFKKILAYTVSIIVTLSIVGLFSGSYNSDYTQTEQAKKTTQDNAAISAGKKAFVEGCTEEGASNTDCTCAFNKMIDMYGVDFVTNEERAKRILSEGYNSRETDAIVECAGGSSNAI